MRQIVALSQPFHRRHIASQLAAQSLQLSRLPQHNLVQLIDQMLLISEPFLQIGNPAGIERRFGRSHLQARAVLSSRKCRVTGSVYGSSVGIAMFGEALDRENRKVQKPTAKQAHSSAILAGIQKNRTAKDAIELNHNDTTGHDEKTEKSKVVGGILKANDYRGYSYYVVSVVPSW
jgi:hypothetical protein